MNLLEYVQRSLDPAKRDLFIKLLNKPWNVDVGALSGHVPAEFARQLDRARSDVLVRLGAQRRSRRPLVYRRLSAIAVGVLVVGPDGTSQQASGNDVEWVDHIWAQVVEDLEECGYQSRHFGHTDRAAFLLLYTLAHACVFLLGGVHIPSTGQASLLATQRNPQALDAHRLYWFAHYLSSQSLMADRALVTQLLENLSTDGVALSVMFKADSRALQTVSDFFIDKYLSLHPDYVELMRETDRPAIAAMKRRSSLIVYLHLWTLRQQLERKQSAVTLRHDRMLPLVVERSELRLAGFEDGEVSALVEECNARSIGDRLLEVTEQGQLHVGDVSLKYALQLYCRAALKSMGDRGMWFEKDYVANYIRERIPADRYSVYPGVNDEEQKYDADVIIVDKRSRALMFCQVKHRSTTLHPHLRDETKEYFNNDDIQHGLFQIKRLRELIATDGVLTRVRQSLRNKRLTTEDLGSRARFMLIHTIESLDFCTSDGVAMYEWNTLRNLLKGSAGFISNSGGERKSAELEIDLSNPVQTMERWWDWLDKAMPTGYRFSPSNQWAFLTTARLVFETRSSWYLGRLKLWPAKPLELSLPLT